MSPQVCRTKSSLNLVLTILTGMKKQQTAHHATSTIMIQPPATENNVFLVAMSNQMNQCYYLVRNPLEIHPQLTLGTID